MRKAAILFCAAALCVAVLQPASAQKAGPKGYISVDMEGIWGVVHGDQVSSTSPEYAAARRW
ncbi:MAG: M55 family metallopeptidase, partial [Acidobacteria bacterium]|nr:M55 family metallopeptidase [Acidobacteriota bacterium]